MTEITNVNAHELSELLIDLEQPTCLFRNGDHAIYWLGITDETAFRCNTYLIQDGADAILVDPGSRAFFNQVKARVAQILAPEAITGMIICHQDPDVAASMVEWLEVNPDIRVFTTPRTQVLLPHYGRRDYRYYDVTREPRLALPSGVYLEFIVAPFLHFSGAFVTYDSRSRYLFSGDIWAALDVDWTLTVRDFEEHVPKMDLFHLDYMASNVATRGFVERIKNYAIDAVLPQHGSILGPSFVQPALAYLREMRCGLDLCYQKGNLEIETPHESEK